MKDLILYEKITGDRYTPVYHTKIRGRIKVVINNKEIFKE